MVSFDDVGHPAFDVRQARLYPGRLDQARRHRRQPEARELVHIRAGARPDADHRIQKVDAGNRDDTLPMFAQRREGMIPRPRRHGEDRREVQHHGPGYGHDVVPAGIVGGDQNHWPRLQQRKRPVQRQLAHKRLQIMCLARIPDLTHGIPRLTVLENRPNFRVDRDNRPELGRQHTPLARASRETGESGSDLGDPGIVTDPNAARCGGAGALRGFVVRHLLRRKLEVPSFLLSFLGIFIEHRIQQVCQVLLAYEFAQAVIAQVRAKL